MIRRALCLLFTLAVTVSGLSACGSKLSEARLRAASTIVVHQDQGTPTAAAPDGQQGSAPTSAPGGGGEPTGGSGAGVGPTPPAAVGPTSTTTTGRGGQSPSKPDPIKPGGVPVTPTTSGPVAGLKAEILLGSFGARSGPIGDNVADFVVGIRAWLADVNERGGVDGHPVRIIFGDDRSDPAQAVTIVRKMVEQDHVIGFVTHHGTATLQAVMPYLEQRKMPVIGTASASDIELTSPYVFNPQLSLAGMPTSSVNSFARTSQARKAALFYCREAASCTTVLKGFKAYAPNAGVHVVYEAQVSLAQPDFTAEVLGARNAGAEVLVLIMDQQSVIRIARSAHQQGWKPLLAGQHASMTESQKHDAVEGLYTFSMTVNYETSPLLAAYRAAVKRFVPEANPGQFGAAAWLHGKTLELAGRSLGDQPTTEQLLVGLYRIKNESFGGLIAPISFFPGAKNGDVNRCSVPVQLQKGHWVSLLGDGKFVCP